MNSADAVLRFVNAGISRIITSTFEGTRVALCAGTRWFAAQSKARDGPEDRKRPRLSPRLGLRLPMRQILADAKRGKTGALQKGLLVHLSDCLAGSFGNPPCGFHTRSAAGGTTIPAGDQSWKFQNDCG